MKSIPKYLLLLLVFFGSTKQYGQHHSLIDVEVNIDHKTLTVLQEIEYFNQSEDSLTSIVLNDWNNAYSTKTSPLGKRFSDEFYRGFHLAADKERGSTQIKNITNNAAVPLSWERTERNPDLIVVKLKQKLAPNEKIVLHLDYIVKVPSDKFTNYGYSERGGMYLKNWFLAAARYENHSFIRYNNLNLDDITNAVSNFDVLVRIPKNIQLTSDLNEISTTQTDRFTIHKLQGNTRTDFSVFVEPDTSFRSFKNNTVEVLTNLRGYKADEIQKAIAIDRIVTFTSDLIGKPHTEKITVAQADYDRNPFYGLNQMPTFLVPFPDDFLFEIKFLKTYLNNYLKNNLKLDPRKDNWIYDGIQVYTMMRYIEEYYPDCKMTGRISDFKLFKGFHLLNLEFNEQYSYFYLLMARKNLDQPLGNSKNTLIKFNEQIASKYRAGLSLIYLDNYLGNNSVSTSIRQFNALNAEKMGAQNDFETLLKSNTKKDIDWFFKTIINSREIIDYKFANVSKTTDSISFSLKNKTKIAVPISVYGLKNDSIVFKKWIEPKLNDSIYTLERKQANKIVINYKNEVPEFNLRNNWKKLEGFYPNNRPVKFAFIKDLEDPYYNQIIYAPILTYNVYDGLSPGVRFHNRAILNRPFVYDINPTYSIKSESLTGSAIFMINKDYRNSTFFNVRYSVSANYFHYAPDASYLKINPMVLMQIRSEDYRDNRKQFLLMRQVIINREKSDIVIDSSLQDYSVFDLKYINTRTELTNHISFVGDVQFSGEFGKISTEIQYRKLFEDNRQLNLRMYAGAFTYNKSNSDFYSFALDRPTDYLFDYAYLGRSSETGLVSQEFILAEGGFKSKLEPAYGNQWITTLNGSYSIWNWIEAYGDIGFVKNSNQKEKFLFDTGIRFNLLTDYFELFFPIYSSKGWEISQPHYNEKIRFVITLNPDKFIQLFTRKWF
ncbi:gluzincin family metallopeptidase [Flavobacterium nackdongense]|uniref:aminopeptidase n=1 Tax=Flavobacterium nackdongense TaxID=2547394 RepID=UPI0026D5E435|nr:aminopeptidase [Flavobacterium nackdongense]